jgi:hypothetical protein
VTTDHDLGSLGVLGVEVDLRFVTARWVAARVDHDHDVIVAAPVDGVAQTQHGSAERTRRRPSHHTTGAGGG